MEAVEELLDVMRYATAQSSTHLTPYFFCEVEPISVSQGTEAINRDLVAPRMQFVVVRRCSRGH